jgi:hypothetical protein
MKFRLPIPYSPLPHPIVWCAFTRPLTQSRHPSGAVPEPKNLDLERLKDVPQPVVVLLEKLLQKDPAQRFRTPSELLTAIPTITSALDTGHRIIRQSLLKTPPTVSRVGTRKPRARLAPKKISVARLPVTGSDVFGREEDIAFLDDAWANQQVNVVTFYVIDSEPLK